MAGSELPVERGLDTSVVLRLLVGAPSDQAARALGFVKQGLAAGLRVVVSDLVVTEAYLALHAHYDVPKAEAVAALQEMLRSGLVEPAARPRDSEILEVAARSSAKPGFVDRLIPRPVPAEEREYGHLRARRGPSHRHHGSLVCRMGGATMTEGVPERCPTRRAWKARPPRRSVPGPRVRSGLA